MKKVEKLSIKALTELQGVVRDRTSMSVEVRRAQAIILVNEKNCSEITLSTVTGYSKNFASKLRKRYQEKGLPGTGLAH